MEKKYRSLLKALSWRFVGTLDTFVISYIFVGKIDVAASIGLFEVVSKTLLYYGHERIWSGLSIGLDKGESEK